MLPVLVCAFVRLPRRHCVRVCFVALLPVWLLCHAARFAWHPRRQAFCLARQVGYGLLVLERIGGTARTDPLPAVTLQS